MAMTEDHKLILQRMRKKFVENMDLKPVVDSLVSNDVLTPEDEDRIEDKDSTQESIRFLLRLLPRKGDRAFFALYDALEKTPWLQTPMRSKEGALACGGGTQMDTQKSNDSITAADGSLACEGGTQMDTQKSNDSITAAEAGSLACEGGTQMDTQKPDDEPDDSITAAEDHRSVVPDVTGSYNHWSVLSTSPNFASEDEFEHMYDMKLQRKGRAYILNNVCNAGNVNLEHYQGACMDTSNLTHVVRELGYEPEIHTNLSSEEIKHTFRTFMSGCQETDISSFVALISSGGHSNGSQYILGTDKVPVYLRKDIYDPTCECRALTHKPKLFFIQINNLFAHTSSIMHQDSTNLQSHLDREKHKHCFVASTFTTGHYSHRRHIQGSWFVQLLCEVMLEEAHITDFDDMMQMIADTAGRCNSFYDFRSGEIVESIEYVIRDTTLERQLYFLPHYEPLRSLQHQSSDVSLPSWFFQEKKEIDAMIDIGPDGHNDDDDELDLT